MKRTLSVLLPLLFLTVLSAFPAAPPPFLRNGWTTNSDANAPVSIGYVVRIFSGSAAPEGAVTANPGSLYMRTNVAGGVNLYSKTNGFGNNTGWSPMATGGSSGDVTTGQLNTSSNSIFSIIVSGDNNSSNGAVAFLLSNLLSVSNYLYTTETVRNSNSVQIAGAGGITITSADIGGGIMRHTVNGGTASTNFQTTTANYSALGDGKVTNTFTVVGVLYMPSGSSITSSNSGFRRRVALWGSGQELTAAISPDITDVELAALDGVSAAQTIQQQLDALVTASSNNVRVVAGANIDVTSSGVGGVQVYTVNNGANVITNNDTRGVQIAGSLKVSGSVTNAGSTVLNGNVNVNGTTTLGDTAAIIANRVLANNVGRQLVSTDVSISELNFLQGVSANVQAQLDAIRTNGPNTWEFKVDAATNYFVENKMLNIAWSSNDFSALFQRVANQVADGGFVHLAGSPYFKGGYTASNTIVITNWIVVCGDYNPSTTIRQASGMTGPTFRVGTSANPSGGINRFVGLRFEGINGTSSGVGIKFENSAEPNMEFCEFNGLRLAGVQLSNPSGSHWSQIQNCWFVTYTVGAQSILIDATPSDPLAQNLTIQNCYFGLGDGRSIVVSNRFRNLMIQDNVFRFTPNFGSVVAMQFYAGEYFTISGNRFQDWTNPVAPIRFEDRSADTNYITVLSDNVASAPFQTMVVTNVAYVGDHVQGVTAIGNHTPTGVPVWFAGNNGTPTVLDSGNGLVALKAKLGASSILTGTGSPESVVAAGPGSTYACTNSCTGSGFYIKTNGTSTTGWWLVQGSAGVGSGDVVGPNSATDNAIARFDSTTGKVIQNSSASVDDSGVGAFNNVLITGGTIPSNSIVYANSATNLAPVTIGPGLDFAGAALRATTNGANSWEVWVDTNSLYFAKNVRTASSFSSNSFAGLMQQVAYQVKDGGYVHVAASPYFTASYVVSNTIVITNWCVIQGDQNANTVMKLSSGATGPMFQVGTPSFTVGGPTGFRGLRLEGSAGATSGVGIQFRDCAEPNVAECLFTGFKLANVQVSQSAANHWSTIRDNSFSVSTAGAHAILFDTSPSDPLAQNVSIRGNIFGIGDGSGIVVSNRFRNIVIANNLFRYSPNFGTVYGIRMFAGEGFSIVNNQFQDWTNPIAPIRLEDRSAATNYNAVVAQNWASSQFPTMAASNVVYVGNNVQGVETWGNKTTFSPSGRPVAYGTGTGPTNSLDQSGLFSSNAVVGTLAVDNFAVRGGTPGVGKVLTSDATGNATWGAAGGGGVADGDKGDITVSGSGATWTIDNGAVTYAKIQNVTGSRLLGRGTAGTGVPAELTVSGGLSFGSSDLSSSTAWQLNNGSTLNYPNFSLWPGPGIQIALTNNTGASKADYWIALQSPLTTAFSLSAPFVTTASAISASDIDWNGSTMRTKTLSANTTFTFSNLADDRWIRILLIQDGTGGRTVTWPGGIVWMNSTNQSDAGAVSQVAGASTLVTLTRSANVIYAWTSTSDSFLLTDLGSLTGLTKGDLFVWDGAHGNRLPVGTDGQVVTADSAQSLGVKWATPSGGGGGSGLPATNGALYETTFVNGVVSNRTFAVGNTTADAHLNGTNQSWTMTVSVSTNVVLTNLSDHVQYSLEVTNAGAFTVTFKGIATSAWINHPASAPVLASNSVSRFKFVRHGTWTNAWEEAVPQLEAIAGKGIVITKNTGTQQASIAQSNDVRSIGVTFDGAGAVLTAGMKAYVEVPYDCIIERVTMLADQSGSAVVDVWKDTYANYPPTVADTITASAKPTISSSVKSQTATLTGWSSNVVAGDIIGFNVDSASSITKLTLLLKVLK